MLHSNRMLLVLTFLGMGTGTLSAQIAFTDGSSALVNPMLRSGADMGIVDMNGDGRDDLVRLSGASDLQIEYQPVPPGVWTRLNYGNLGPGTEWGMCIADADANGYNDLVIGGGYNGLKYLRANPTGTNYTQSLLGGPLIFSQGSNFADIDSDGDIDVFCCHDEGLSTPYSNDGAGALTYTPSLIVTTSTIPSDNSGNYGTVWADYDNDDDYDMFLSKCRLGVPASPPDGRRLNLLFQNNASAYTDVAVAAGLRPTAQSWSTDFADIDNDGDLDALIVTHDITSQLYVNNGNGTFSNITVAAGMSAELAIVAEGMQIKFEDFDNDTWVDVLITAKTGQHRLFRNNGNSTFTAVVTPFSGPTRIHSAAVGDLNHDGFIDVLAGYATSYNSPSGVNNDRIFINNGNSNNWFNVQLTGVGNNRNAIGSRVELHGSWGMQIREVRGGESYGITNSYTVHFGLGSATSIDRLVVRWPLGASCEVVSPAINQFYALSETCAGAACTASAPASPASRDATIGITSSSPFAAVVNLDFEFSLDGGVTYSPCTASASSPLANPATGVATGAASFIWDTLADSVGVAGTAFGVRVRVTVDDAMSPMNGVCLTSPFDVNNVPQCSLACGDCNQSSTGPDILDSLQGAQFAAGLGSPSPVQLFCCDVDGDTDIDVLDSLQMAQVAAGLPVTMTCP